MRALVGGRRSQRLRPRARLRAGTVDEPLGLEIERMLAVAREHDHEHLVAALRALHEQGRDDRHQHARERIAAILTPALVGRSGLCAVRAQRLVVLAEQLALVCAALLHRQSPAGEIGRVGHRAAPAHGLPVEHGQRPRATRLAEEEVVEPVVPMHETLRGVARVVQPRHEALAERAVLVRDVLAVALQQAGEQLRHERLIERARPVQPFAGGERGIFEHGRMQARQLAQREPRLRHARARNLIALRRRRDVLE